MSTSELSAACAARTAADALESLGYKLRDVGTPEAKQHAKEAVGAAKIARAWGRALDKEHRAKLRSAKKARSPANVEAKAPT